MNERKELTWVDWAGIGMFGVGAFGAVLMLIAMSHSAPLAQAGGTAAIAATWSQGIGVFPSIFWNAAIAFLGAKLFLQGERRTLIRNLIGVTGLALALAVFLGALNATAGGVVGEHTGALVTRMTHLTLGGLLGLVVVFAVVWLTWLRESSASKPAAVGLPAQQQLVPEPARAARNVRPAVARSAAANEGVTAAESVALFPAQDLDRDEPEVRKIVPPNVTKAPAPASPYPEDVRLKGRIPAGAKPLETMNAAASDVQAPTVYRWTAPRASEQRLDAPDADLVAAVAPEVLARTGRRDATEPEAADDGVIEERARAAEVDEMAGSSSLEADATAGVLAPLPSPSWEQPALFAGEEAEVEDEPVDAYGTPLSLVERLRQARLESGIEPATEEASNAPRAASQSADEPGALGNLEDLEEPEALTDEDEADLFTVVVEEDEQVVAEDEADEDDFEDEFEAQVVLEETELVLVPDEGGLDADEDSLAEDESYAEATNVVPIAGVPPVEQKTPAAALLFEGATSEPIVVDVQPAQTPAAAVAAAQPSLFDAVEPRRKSGASVPPTSGERDVVLQPQAAVPPERAEKQPASLEGRRKLLADVGCLFVERGRVAVSMLQRQYSMDFDQACKMLDDLQEMGLIGPYLGGQRRDILLTREQWLEKVSSS